MKMLFKSNVFDNINNDLINSFLELIELNRRGEVVELSILKSFIKFLCSIEVNYMESLYNSDLENRIIENTIKFYSSLLAEFFNINFTQYLTWGIEIIKKEEEMLQAFLPTQTITKIVQSLKDLLFFSHSKVLLESYEGFKFLLKTLKFDVKYN
jgi:hypothetical protein